MQGPRRHRRRARWPRSLGTLAAALWWTSALLAALGALLLLRFRVNALWLVLAGSLIGLGRSWLG
jgi:hypothetical protein